MFEADPPDKLKFSDFSISLLAVLREQDNFI